ILPALKPKTLCATCYHLPFILFENQCPNPILQPLNDEVPQNDAQDLAFSSTCNEIEGMGWFARIAIEKQIFLRLFSSQFKLLLNTYLHKAFAY
ncbi:MAG: hypothetical protein ACK5JQ_11545, partial [Bacteroidota bacterium]